jgi:hypothetical protein
MSLSDVEFIKSFCCSNSDYSHIAVEPVQLECKAFSCKKCFLASTKSIKKCITCQNYHQFDEKSIKDVSKLVNRHKTIELKKKLNEITFFTNNKFNDFLESIQEDKINDDIELFLTTVYSNMDLRIESLIKELQKHRDEFKENLQSFGGQMKKQVRVF